MSVIHAKKRKRTWNFAAFLVPVSVSRATFSQWNDSTFKFIQWCVFDSSLLNDATNIAVFNQKISKKKTKFVRLFVRNVSVDIFAVELASVSIDKWPVSVSFSGIYLTFSLYGSGAECNDFQFRKCFVELV